MNALANPNPAYYPIIDAAPKLSDSTKLQYIRALDRMRKAGISPENLHQLIAYFATLPPSSQAFLKSALNILYADDVRRLKASIDPLTATPEQVAKIQAALWNLEELHKAIQTRKDKGKKTSIWLTLNQVEQITALPDRKTSRGRRDWIVLSTILGAGLRRSEMASLTFGSLKRQPKKNGQLRGTLEIHGKGDKYRSVPIKPLLEERIEEWHKEVGDGRIARAINRHGTINGSLSGHAVNDIVAKYGAMIGLPELEAHDLRRTWAQVGINSGIPIQQISKLLGHASIKTTQDYLDLSIDIETTVSDFMPLSE
jgi:site-specific recombinase XerD